MASVLHLFRSAKKHTPMEEVPEALALVDFGFEGCAHAKPGSRQVLLVDRESLEAMNLQPGWLRETNRPVGLTGMG